MKVKNVSQKRRAILEQALLVTAVSAFPLSVLAQASKKIKIGFISPQTGPLSVFGETDNFTVKNVKEALKSGLTINGVNYAVEIIVKDSQSNPNRASSIAQELINKEKVDLLLTAATPDTTNPVSDQAELAGVPCISTAAPWQAWYFGRGATPQKGFEWTYHFFFGLDDAIDVYDGMWKGLNTNKTVGLLLPNDSDGDAWASKQHGLPPALSKLGYKVIEPGRFQSNTDNFSSIISAFKKANVEIITGVMNPPDWTTFWNQARQQGFKPKVATIAKALVFPQAVENLGKAGEGLSSEVVWSRNHPFKSTINGLTCAQYADLWEKDTKKQATQPLGWIHALFEVAIDVLKRSGDPQKKASVRDAIGKTNMVTIQGPVNFTNGPVKNVSRISLVGGQWKQGGKYKYDIDIVSNTTAKNIPTTAKIRVIP